MPKGSTLSAYGDDEPTAEELRLLEEHNQDGTVPPPDNSDEDPENAAPPAQSPPAPDADDRDPALVDDEQQPGGQSQDKLADFIERHKGKTSEELIELAFQQQQRSKRAEFDGRQTSQQLQSVLERVQNARQAAAAKAQEARDNFDKRLADDPDAAIRDARQQQIADAERSELDRLDREEFEARADAAVNFAASVIPNFQEQAPKIRNFGMEMGFTQQEVDQVVDGRQIVTLHLASIAGNLIKAGLIDPSGRFLSLPKPADEQQGGDAPRRFGKQPARGAEGKRSLEDRLGDINAMSDDDFSKLDPAELEELLRLAEQA